MSRFLTFRKLLLFYIFLFFLYGIWTYFLTDKNLVLLNNSFYWSWQNWMWGWGKEVVTSLYIILISLIFLLYLIFLKFSIFNFQFSEVGKFKLFFLIPIFLIFSYNALSHDIFNYIFNARMVVKYSVDPHVQVALNFAQDDWIRFMHNVHTPAPYWYGWTVFSLPFYLIGLGKFLTTWLSFKLGSGLGFVFLLFSVKKLLDKMNLVNGKFWLFALALNPLLLIELFSNAHNDAWMMGFAIYSLSVIWKKSERNLRKILLSLFLLIFSISMKYVTVILVPFWLFVMFSKSFKFVPPKIVDLVSHYFFDLISLAFFLPLLSARSQQFHPWYLLWSMSFLPFIKIKKWRIGLLILSMSSLFRYVPWLWNGAFEFTDAILFAQRLITWLPFVGWWVIVIIKKYCPKNRNT